MARPKKTQEKKVTRIERLAIVNVTRKYYDMELGRTVNDKEVMSVSQDRAKQLIDAKVAEVVSIKK